MLFLKQFTDFALATCSGKLFHKLIILLVKKYWNCFRLVLNLVIFLVLERVLSSELKTNRLEVVAL